VARATTIINWSDPSVVITMTGTTSGTVTGKTTGDHVVPFLVNVTIVNGAEDISRSILGNYATPLNLDIQAGRTSTTLMTTTISIPGYNLQGVSYTLFDVDASDNKAPYTSWQDKIMILEGPMVAAALDPTTVTVSGSTLLGKKGNVGNTSTNGNVNISDVSSLVVPRIKVTFGPGPNDQFGNNQRFGFSNITIQQLNLAVPEPETYIYTGIGLAACLVGGVRRRPPAEATASDSAKVGKPSNVSFTG